MRHCILCALLLLLLPGLSAGQAGKRIIQLSRRTVVDISRRDNLSLKVKAFEHDAQNLETWKSLSSFLPSLSYQGFMQKSIELPVFVFMGQRFVVGTPYTFQHSLSLSLPVFTGGSRWSNYRAQRSIERSLSEELQGKEEETVLAAMQAYYGIMLSEGLARSAQEAATVAERNLDQVRKFYEAGTATELDFQRAKAQHSSTLPQLESALANRQLSVQRLKSFLDIPFTDSLVVLDSLESTDYLGDYARASLADLQGLSRQHRNDLKALQYRQEAAGAGEDLALGQFAPTVAVTASLDHVAPLENARVRWSDYIRSKSISLSVSWPLFEGGRRILDWQIAKIRGNQVDLLAREAALGAELEVEQYYYHFVETSKSLQSLKDALDQYRESLRIASVLYEQGVSNQLDVLNAQLLCTKSEIDYMQGIYSYNVSQLALLRSIGLLDLLWK